MWAVLDRRKSQDFIMTRLLSLFLVSLLHMPGSSGEKWKKEMRRKNCSRFEFQLIYIGLDL